MHLVALILAVTACAAIVVVGSRFFLVPQRATTDYGVAADDVRALTQIKGVRDITLAVVPLVIWAAAGSTALGWTLVAAALVPVVDAVIVLTRGGKPATALGVHGVSAVLLLAVGLVLALA